ncbi:MAG: oligosaccharide flippase family protein [Vulcanimicrobiaceae bacterium]
MSTTAVQRGRQVFANTLAGLCGNTGSALIGLAITPYLIYRLGFEAYGFWVVLSAVVNYVGLVDVGLETTFIKYTAEYTATNQQTRVRQVTTFGVLFYIVLGILMSPIAFVIAPYLVSWMKVSPDLAVQGPTLFALIIAAFFLQSSSGVIGSVLGGIGSLRLVSLTNFIARIGYAAAAVTGCFFGLGIYGLLIATFVQIAMTAAIAYGLARRITGKIFINPLHLEPNVMKRLFKLGGWIQLTNLSSTITMETNRLIISIFVQTSAVTLFEVANKLTRTARSLPFPFLVSLLPAVSALDALGGDDDAFTSVYLRASRFMNFASIALLGFVIGAAEPIMKAWLGHTYPELGTLVALLGSTYIISNVTQVGTTMLRATGKPRYEAFLSIWSAAVSIAAMFAFVPRFGVIGVAAGMLSGSIAGTAYFLYAFHRLHRLSAVRGFFAWYARLGCSGLVAVLTTYAVLFGITKHAFFNTRLGAIAAIAIAGIAYLMVFAAGLAITRFFSAGDASALLAILPRPVRRLLPLREKSGAPATAA